MKNKIIQWFKQQEPDLMRAFMSTHERLDYHPEGNTWDHLMLVLDAALDPRSLMDWGDMEEVDWLMLIFHDLGKPITGGVRPYQDGNLFCLMNKSHKGHDDISVDEIEFFFEKKRKDGDLFWDWSKDNELLCKTVAKFHQRVHGVNQSSASSIQSLIKEMMNFTNWNLEHRGWNKVWKACQSDARGRLGFESIEYHQANIMKMAIDETLDWELKGKHEFIQKKESLKAMKHEKFKSIKSIEPDVKDDLIWKEVSLYFKNHPLEMELNLTQKINNKVNELKTKSNNEKRFKNNGL